MAIRKRKWKTKKGTLRSTWVCDYAINGTRVLKTFKNKKQAERFSERFPRDDRINQLNFRPDEARTLINLYIDNLDKLKNSTSKTTLEAIVIEAKRLIHIAGHTQ